MIRIVLFIAAMVIQYIGMSAYAYELNHSGKTDGWNNPFIAYGYNPVSKITTGYLAALRTAPGRTDACKLVFKKNANSDGFLVRYIGERGASGDKGQLRHLVSSAEQGVLNLQFSKSELDGDCNWILPFVVESDVSEDRDEVMVAIEIPNIGNWIAVYAINSKKARFYSDPDNSSSQKAFLVKGDIIYVYEERPDWYFVKYNEGKTKTEGWIRKSDTLQP
jgi:hypothetical protein